MRSSSRPNQSTDQLDDGSRDPFRDELGWHTASRPVEPDAPTTILAQPAGLRVQERLVAGALVLEVRGALDVHSLQSFSAVIERLFAPPCRRIVLDMSSLTGADRHGLAVLAGAAEQAEDWDVPLAVCGLSWRYQYLLPSDARDMVFYSDLAEAITFVSNQLMPGEPTRSELLQRIDTLEMDNIRTARLEQAKGMLMAVHGVPESVAAAMLTKYSAVRGVSLGDLTLRLTTAPSDPDVSPVVRMLGLLGPMDRE